MFGKISAKALAINEVFDGVMTSPHSKRVANECIMALKAASYIEIPIHCVGIFYICHIDDAKKYS